MKTIFVSYKEKHISMNCEHLYVLTLISFLIYKEWQVLSLENNVKRDKIELEHFKQDLILRQKIYERCEIYAYMLNYMLWKN